MEQTIAILDFGSQYAQLIARRVRENRVFSILCPPSISPQKLRELHTVGLIFSGGPASVYENRSPRCDPALLEMGLPVLGICYGCSSPRSSWGHKYTRPRPGSTAGPKSTCSTGGT